MRGSIKIPLWKTFKIKKSKWFNTRPINTRRQDLNYWFNIIIDKSSFANSNINFSSSFTLGNYAACWSYIIRWVYKNSFIFENVFIRRYKIFWISHKYTNYNFIVIVNNCYFFILLILFNCIIGFVFLIFLIFKNIYCLNI